MAKEGPTKEPLYVLSEASVLNLFGSRFERVLIMSALFARITSPRDFEALERSPGNWPALA
jgi:hypothetical protein